MARHAVRISTRQNDALMQHRSGEMWLFWLVTIGGYELWCLAMSRCACHHTVKAHADGKSTTPRHPLTGADIKTMLVSMQCMRQPWKLPRDHPLGWEANCTLRVLTLAHHSLSASLEPLHCRSITDAKQTAHARLRRASLISPPPCNSSLPILSPSTTRPPA